MIPNKEKLEKIIKELQRIMRIQDWDIEVLTLTKAEMCLKWGNEGEDLGHYSVNERRNYAEICFGKDAEENQQEWYNTIVHELIHIATIRYRTRQLEMLSHIDEKIRNIIHENVTEAYESMVDNLTRCFCTIYPETNFIKECERNEEGNE